MSVHMHIVASPDPSSYLPTYQDNNADAVLKRLASALDSAMEGHRGEVESLVSNLGDSGMMVGR